MRRVAVVGSSGAGKSTLARQVAERLGLTHVELDAIYHQPNWTPLADDEFVRRVAQALDDADAATDGWTLCGGYDQVEPLRVARADTIVWLDYSKALVTWRVTTRTIRRALTREELWNGNREPITNFTSWDPEKNVIRWSWVHFEERRTRYSDRMRHGSWHNLDVHRFASPSDTAAWVESLGPNA